MDDLRLLVAKADALASAAQSLFDEALWGEDGDHARKLERLAYIVGAVVDAMRAASEAADSLADQPATAPGGSAHADQ